MEHKNAKILLIILGVLLILPLVSASSFKCYTKVEYANDIIQINPAQTNIDQVGIIDYFEPQPSDSKYQYVKVYFTKKDLRDNEAVNFSVICAGENQTLTFEQEITPQYKDLNTELVDRAIWTGDNMIYILMGLFLVLIIIFIVIAVFKGVAQ